MNQCLYCSSYDSISDDQCSACGVAFYTPRRMNYKWLSEDPDGLIEIDVDTEEEPESEI